MPTMSKVCPRCFKTRPHNEYCKTPECQPFLLTPTYVRDELEGNLHIARTLLAEGDKEQDWPTVVQDIERELKKFDALLGPAAFTQ